MCVCVYVLGSGLGKEKGLLFYVTFPNPFFFLEGGWWWWLKKRNEQIYSLSKLECKRLK